MTGSCFICFLFLLTVLVFLPLSRKGQQKPPGNISMKTWDAITTGSVSYTAREILQEGKRLEIPVSLEVLKAAKKLDSSEQMGLL